MLFNLATLALPLVFFGGMTTATPLEAREVTAVKAPGADVSKLKFPVPIPASGTEGKVVVPHPGKSTISPNSAFHVLASTVEDTVIVCSAPGCSGTCIAYALSSLHANVCYGAGEPFVSFAIYQASNTGLPYGVYVGEHGCKASVLIPTVDACYYSPDPSGSARTLHTFFRH
ncbi:hypothetical protein BS47DRAFT_540395 [Hydnum rufescens UP504]|uniref:Uncharacterized protein n=1 Tax=Hydnum rufescens UP504 TaxID=1448309 RepID=A0A9P6E0K8_9AGAM|nr:hypothetical protein BS47DRAFT_540395 [Hydnum rufescens UP504]